VRAVPRLCEFYPGICLTTEEKARKNLSQGKKNLSHVKKNLSHVKKNLSHVKKNLSHITKTSFTVQKPQSQYKNLSHSTETSVTVQKPQSQYRNLSHITKTSVKVQYTYYQKHPHITKPSQTHTLQNPLIYALQNNIQSPQYKLKRNAYRKSKST